MLGTLSGLGGLGLVPARGEGMPPVGVEYVLSTPSGRGVLRPLRYPFYDTEVFEDGQTEDRTFFTDHKKFATGENKTECDTNMTLDSQLGHPNLFDLVGFTGELDFGISQVDFNNFYRNTTWRWIFGQNTVFTRIRTIKIPQGIGPYGFNSAGTIITNGLPVVGAFYNFTTPDRRARRIDSTEQFRGEVHLCTALSLSTGGPGPGGRHTFTAYMLGILYSNL